MKRHQRPLMDKVLDRALQLVIAALMLSVIGAAIQIKPIDRAYTEARANN